MRKTSTEQEEINMHMTPLFFGLMSPEKHNVGEPVQQLRVCIIKQSFLNTIWMPKSSYSTENLNGKKLVRINSY